MAVARSKTYSCPSGGRISGGRYYAPPQATPYEVQANGGWLESTCPKMVHDSGVTYTGYISAGGTVGVRSWRHADGATAYFNLFTTSADDHAAPSIYIRLDGRIIVFYSAHNDGGGLRYRISTNPRDISAFGAEQVLAGSSDLVTYSNPRRLSANGRLYLFYRNWDDQRMRYSDDDGSTWSAEIVVFVNSNRPYPYYTVTDTDRIDILSVQGGPMVLNSSVYHCYAKLVAGVLRWYKTDGTELTLPINPTNCTTVYDGSAIPAIWLDIRKGPDGNLWALFTKYLSQTDGRYMFTKCVGGAWQTPVEVAPAGYPLYAANWGYMGGACFDLYDNRRVYVSYGASASGPWEIAAYDTTNGGATWAKTRDITSGSATGVANARPNAVVGRGPARFGFWSGRYTTYSNYSTKILLGA